MSNVWSLRFMKQCKLNNHAGFSNREKTPSFFTSTVAYPHTHCKDLVSSHWCLDAPAIPQPDRDIHGWRLSLGKEA